MCRKGIDRRIGHAVMLAAASLALSFGVAGHAQQADMSFFVTSTGSGKGADFGGLEGADKHCGSLASAAGAGNRIWRAYLSASASGGAAAVNARDRIGKGPWVNAKGATSSHPSRGCGDEALRGTGGAGLLYCFAAN